MIGWPTQYQYRSLLLVSLCRRDRWTRCVPPHFRLYLLIWDLYEPFSWSEVDLKLKYKYHISVPNEIQSPYWPAVDLRICHMFVEWKLLSNPPLWRKSGENGCRVIESHTTIIVFSLCSVNKVRPFNWKLLIFERSWRYITYLTLIEN